MFFFYSVTDVISNVAKYNTSVKIYLSKSKITDFKNDLKNYKVGYTKKLLNYSNVSECNLLLYTSGYVYDSDFRFLLTTSLTGHILFSDYCSAGTRVTHTHTHTHTHTYKHTHTRTIKM